ncbi:hypothetical protein HV127_22625 [Klebsiella sp. RHBSTW-00215]|uniref:hypothetical protein n=1 Tax=Klebsiella sp. RHBSTW-00215 TaxID=2742640 RepID=UPI0015F42BCC|nr:hypothetical protein [Klebsiella sp. RHBSTW-00215]MBA7934015.1 hypothetical protein [Klebsiella sp. RHBSTW-00215]
MYTYEEAKSLLREGIHMQNSVSSDAVFSIEAVVETIDGVLQTVPTLMKSDGELKVPYELTPEDIGAEWFFL